MSGQFFGSVDIDFESHPILSTNDLFRSDHKEGVRCVFIQQVLSYFELQKADCTHTSQTLAACRNAAIGSSQVGINS